jgi:hypothetical protein
MKGGGMADVGRNQLCPCGSGAKSKRCCGSRRGPSERDLARAFLSEQGRAAVRVLRQAIDESDDLVELYKAVTELPRLDLRLQLPLPRLLSPALERLRAAIADEDPDEFEESLPAALAEVDDPLTRAHLARSVIALGDEGRIPREVAATALVDLDSEAEAVVREALVAALAVDCGAARTPSGLVLVG